MEISQCKHKKRRKLTIHICFAAVHKYKAATSDTYPASRKLCIVRKIMKRNELLVRIDCDVTGASYVQIITR